VVRELLLSGIHTQSKRSSKPYLPKPTAVKKMHITTIIPVRANVGEDISNFGRRSSTNSR
jgi:hypothetical protein